MNDERSKLQATQLELKEMKESFAKLQLDYCELSDHAELLESILDYHEIPYPDCSL